MLLLKAKYVELVQKGAMGEALQVGMLCLLPAVPLLFCCRVQLAGAVMQTGPPARSPAPLPQVLRTELQPLAVQQQVLHSLAALLLRSPQSPAPPSPAAGAAASPGSSSSGGTAAAGLLAPAQPPVSEEQLTEGRVALLNQLQDSLLPSLLIPERRLEELIEQVRGGGEGRSGRKGSRAPHSSLHALRARRQACAAWCTFLQEALQLEGATKRCLLDLLTGPQGRAQPRPSCAWSACRRC